MAISLSDLGARFLAQLGLAEGLELTLDGSVLRNVGDDDRQLVDGLWVGLLLGADFSEDHDDLLEPLVVWSEHVLWSLEHALSEELILDLGLLQVVGDWKERHPVGEEGS